MPVIVSDHIAPNSIIVYAEGGWNLVVDPATNTVIKAEPVAQVEDPDFLPDLPEWVP